MPVFDRNPDIKQNTFTLEDASKVFADVSAKINDNTLPAEVAGVALETAKTLLELLKVFAG